MTLLLFLEKDIHALNEKIQETEQKLKDVSKEIGKSVTQTSETWHDNFGFEEHSRQHLVVLKELADLKKIKEQADIITPPKTPEKVTIGTIVKIQNIENDKSISLFISSYRIYDEQHKPEVSYTAPLAKALLGYKEGETVQVDLPAGTATYKIETVS